MLFKKLMISLSKRFKFTIGSYDPGEPGKRGGARRRQPGRWDAMTAQPVKIHTSFP